MENSTVVTTHTAIATPDLAVVDGQITTTSNQIAEHFGKRHADVMRAIKRLECSAEFTERNFALSEFLDATGRKLPCYRITRDGFVFLAMGFTGKEAAQWKEAYITAFNKMEAELRAKEKPAADPAIDYTRISPAQAQDLREIVKAIVDAKIQGHAETWARLQRKFRVNSYLQLPASRHLEAREYLIAKLPSGYAGDLFEEEPKVQPVDLALVESAMTAANTVAARVQKEAFMAMVQHQQLDRCRFQLSIGYGATGELQVKPIEDAACVATIPQMAAMIEAPGAIQVESQDLMSLAKACMNRLATRLEARTLTA